MKSLTGALEDYLETIFLLQQEQPYARVKDIAKARNVKPGSVSPAVKRLAKLGLVEYHQREYIRLTETGEAEGRRVYAKHRLLTRFFENVLQMDPEIAERDACALEHSLSDEAMDRMVRFFEYLTVCPDSSLELIKRFQTCSRVHPNEPHCSSECSRAGIELSKDPVLSVKELAPGQMGVVRQVLAEGAVRQRLLDLGLLPDTKVEVLRKAPGGDPIWVRVQNTQLALRSEEAETVLIHRHIP